MNLLSANFLYFLTAVALLYFLLPKRFQWMVLLGGSLFFYWCTGWKNLIFIGITAASSWLAGLYMDRTQNAQKAYLAEHKAELDREAKKKVRAGYQRKRRAAMVLVLLLNFGLLAWFKYLHFAIAQINLVLGAFHGGQIVDAWKLIVPLGISFYTFQTMGYVVDVYWQKTEAEKNFARLLLFTAFFPQLTQGPISDYRELTAELFAEHSYSYRNFSWGAMRMFWGFFKKMALANVLNLYVQDLYANYGTYTGAAVLAGAFCYSIQIYADFSGYMDIVCGFCEILGIKLTENFQRPYFSKSIAEYWRRWHISLGRWFRTYIYYPIAVAKWNRELGSRAQKRFGPAFGRALPASVALVVVWLTTGLWHGASWAYIAWGGVNGLFIIFSLWMEPVYESWKKALHVNESHVLWRAFQVIRTFFLVTLIKILPEVGTLGQGLGLWKRIFTEHTVPTSLRVLVPMAHISYVHFATICLGTVMVFGVSMVQRQQPFRRWLEDHVPYVLRVLLFVLLMIFTIYIGYPLIDKGGGFMYQGF